LENAGIDFKRCCASYLKANVYYQGWEHQSLRIPQLSPGKKCRRKKKPRKINKQTRTQNKRGRQTWLDGSSAM
jgi:hypothetical protein